MSATPRHIILRWQSDKMAPRPDLVLQNVLKNATDGKSQKFLIKVRKPRPKLPQHESFKLDGDRYQQV